jgi:hypothetical protein
VIVSTGFAPSAARGAERERRERQQAERSGEVGDAARPRVPSTSEVAPQIHAR